jgi:hypothetical protein
MSYRLLILGLTLSAAGASCARSPVSPAGDATVTTPVPTSPANGALIANSAQPVVLTVNNALVTKAGAVVSYTFEVSTDAGLSAIVSAKDVPERSGQTTATLDVLPPARDYYWHVRTNGGSTIGAFTPVMKFTIGAAVTLGTPVPLSPASGAAAGPRPTLTVSNVTRTGPVGPLSYRFEISTSTTFTPILASGTVPEGVGTTSFTPASDLATDGSYYWRAQAIDASNDAASAFSTPETFATIAGSGPTPPNDQPVVKVSARLHRPVAGSDRSGRRVGRFDEGQP